VALAVGNVYPQSHYMALAVEVQQSRARRCDGCRHVGQEKGDLLCERHSIDRAFWVRPDWFCADFTAKE
jgi:hypothetical protein